MGFFVPDLFLAVFFIPKIKLLQGKNDLKVGTVSQCFGREMWFSNDSKDKIISIPLQQEMSCGPEGLWFDMAVGYLW